MAAESTIYRTYRLPTFATTTQLCMRLTGAMRRRNIVSYISYFNACGRFRISSLRTERGPCVAYCAHPTSIVRASVSSTKSAKRSRHMAWKRGTSQGQLSRYQLDPTQRVATRLDQGRRGVLVIFEGFQRQLDIPIVSQRGHADEQSKDVNLDNRHSVEHQDGRERELKGARNSRQHLLPLFLKLARRGAPRKDAAIRRCVVQTC